jgi:hypothetical protein
MHGQAEIVPKWQRAAAIPRLALTRGESAVALGVSVDFLDEHVVPEVRIVRRGRRTLIPVVELERRLRTNAALADPSTRSREASAIPGRGG